MKESGEVDPIDLILALTDRCVANAIDMPTLAQALEALGARDNQWRQGRSGLVKALEDIVHFLHHYSVDDDIRSKDHAYGEFQRTKLTELGETVRAHLSLANVTHPR